MSPIVTLDGLVSGPGVPVTWEISEVGRVKEGVTVPVAVFMGDVACVISVAREISAKVPVDDVISDSVMPATGDVFATVPVNVGVSVSVTPVTEGVSAVISKV